MASSRTYIHVGARIEGSLGDIFPTLPLPSTAPSFHPQPRRFCLPSADASFCFVLINSSVMCLQDETHRVAQDHKESALATEGPRQGVRSICSPQFPLLLGRKLFASFFFRSHHDVVRESYSYRRLYRRIQGAELSRFSARETSCRFAARVNVDLLNTKPKCFGTDVLEENSLTF